MGTYNKHKLNDDRQTPNRSEGRTVNMQIELDYQEEGGVVEGEENKSSSGPTLIAVNLINKWASEIHSSQFNSF